MSEPNPLGDLEQARRDVRQRLLLMMDLAEGMMWSAVLALVTRDRELARSVVLAHAQLVRGHRELDALCLDLLADHGRAAQRLTVVRAALRVAPDLARSGDVALSVSTIALELAGEEPLYHYDDLLTLAGLVHGMMSDVRAGLGDADAARMASVIARQRDVEASFARVFAELLERTRHDGRGAERGPRLLRTAHALDRLATLSVQVAQALHELLLDTDGCQLGRASTLPPLKTSARK
jgi:phosphate transport system protein